MVRLTSASNLGSKKNQSCDISQSSIYLMIEFLRIFWFHPREAIVLAASCFVTSHGFIKNFGTIALNQTVFTLFCEVMCQIFEHSQQIVGKES